MPRSPGPRVIPAGQLPAVPQDDPNVLDRLTFGDQMPELPALQARDGCVSEAVAARLVPRESTLIDQQDVVAQLGELVGRGAARRTSTDDHDLGLVDHTPVHRATAASQSSMIRAPRSARVSVASISVSDERAFSVRLRHRPLASSGPAASQIRSTRGGSSAGAMAPPSAPAKPGSRSSERITGSE